MKRHRAPAIALGLAVWIFACPAHGKHNIEFIRADQVHAMGITGRGVTVAVIDDGVDYGPWGPVGSIAPGGASFMGGGSGIDDGGYAQPGYTHGTQVALVVRDVAPNVRILPIRVSLVGATFYPVLARAIEYVIDQRQSDPTIRVINISVGSAEGYEWECDLVSEAARQLAQPVNDAAAAGIVTFACTGNECNCLGTILPSCVSCAVPVIADYDAHSDTPVDWPCGPGQPGCSDERPDPCYVMCFSNMVSACEWFLGAPGYHIVAGMFAEENGTSFATGECSGVGALMFEKSGPCGTLDAYSAREIIVQHGRVFEYSDPHCRDAPEPRHVDAVLAVTWTPGGVCAQRGDLDGDGTISANDFRWFEDCMTGPAVTAPIAFCAAAKSAPPLADEDTGVDLRDFAQFQLAFTGYGSGACCHPHGECSITTVKDCADEFGAVYQGHGTTCDGAQCDPGDWGACCHPDTQTCTESTRENCIWGDPGLGDEGLYLGDGTRCATATCPALRYRNVIDPPTTIVPCGEGLQLADDITLEGGEPTGLAYYDVGVSGGTAGFFDVTVGLYTDCPGFGGTLIEGTERTFADNPNYGAPVFLTATFDPPVYIPNHFWMVATFSDPTCGCFVAERAEVGYTFDVFARNDGTVDDPLWVCNYWWGDRLHVESPADVGGEGESGKAWIVC
ncbi:MAG TPA: S8 family serine peptidase [Phycisphaerae bacterium]|nr:S8 family serine peptidase [Phycisphaerae bacterium]